MAIEVIAFKGVPTATFLATIIPNSIIIIILISEDKYSSHSLLKNLSPSLL